MRLIARRRKMAAARLAEGGVRELSRRPPEILLLGARASQEAKCFGGPTAHVGPDLCNQLQRGMRSDAVDLTEVGAAGQPMQWAADIELGLMLGTPLARCGQWC